METNISPPCPGCQFPWDGVHADIHFGGGRRTERSERVCSVCGFATDDPYRGLGQRFLAIAKAIGAERSSRAPSEAPANQKSSKSERRAFEFFVPYRLDQDKLLEREFELTVTRRPSESATKNRLLKVTGRDLQAMFQNASDIESNWWCELRLDGIEYSSREDDKAAFALLTALNQGPGTAIGRQALAGLADFYLLRQMSRLANTSHFDMVQMFAIADKDDDDYGSAQTAALEFKYYSKFCSDLEHLADFFESYLLRDDWKPKGDDIVIAQARIARDFQEFFRTNPAGPFWAAAFSQRALVDANVSAMLVLCMPELPGMAAIHVAHAIRSDQAELQSAIANRVIDHVQAGIRSVRIGVKVLVIFCLVAGAFLMLR